jgi:hypothetical protein
LLPYLKIRLKTDRKRIIEVVLDGVDRSLQIGT